MHSVYAQHLCTVCSQKCLLQAIASVEIQPGGLDAMPWLWRHRPTKLACQKVRSRRYKSATTGLKLSANVGSKDAAHHDLSHLSVNNSGMLRLCSGKQAAN